MLKMVSGSHFGVIEKSLFCVQCGCTANHEYILSNGSELPEHTSWTWMEDHLKSCPKLAINIEASNKLISNNIKWIDHDECGHSMIISHKNGFVLIENNNGRYIVPASDVRISNISSVLEDIRSKNYSHEELCSLVSNLLIDLKLTDIKPMLSTNNVIEFVHMDNYVKAAIIGIKSKRRLIVKPLSHQLPPMNINVNKVLRILS